VVVIGIDPGLATTGYGLVSEDKGRLRAVEFGNIKTPASAPMPERLHKIADELGEVIGRRKPDCASIEQIFAAVNVKSALALGHVRGAILYELSRCRIAVHEYSATQIKKALVGYGQAAKFQVSEMVRLLLGLGSMQLPDDAGDALAAAICHLHSRGPLAAGLGESK